MLQGPHLGCVPSGLLGASALTYLAGLYVSSQEAALGGGKEGSRAERGGYSIPKGTLHQAAATL